ncbi:MAG: hypothetical protein ACR2PX_03565, partial [Endozoicomonas sp.]|uniref:hypothetical protein n=1 Tax=Endozoicomonas sp. TaxID=1892382 RepID=UPI003D9B1F41
MASVVFFQSDSTEHKYLKFFSGATPSNETVVEMDIHWHSESGRPPALTLCGLSHIPVSPGSSPDPAVTFVTTPYKMGSETHCYQLQPDRPSGSVRVIGKGDLAGAGSFINVEEVTGSWALLLEINPEGESLSSNLLSSNEGYTRTLNDSTNTNPLIPAPSQSWDKPALYQGGVDLMPGDGLDRRFRPWFAGGSESSIELLIESLMNYWAGDAEPQTEELPAYLVKINSDEGTHTVYLTQADWRWLVANKAVSVRGVFSFLQQIEKQCGQRECWMTDLQYMLDKSDLGENNEPDAEFINNLLISLTLPAEIEVTHYDNLSVPGIISLSGRGQGASKQKVGSGSSSNAAPSRASRQSSTGNHPQESGDSASGGGADGGGFQQSDSSFSQPSGPTAPLDLEAILSQLNEHSFPEDLAIVFYGARLITYEEMQQVHSELGSQSKKERLIKQLKQIVENSEKVAALQIMYEFLHNTPIHSWAAQPMLQAVPDEYKKQVQQPFRFVSREPSDSDQALEVLSRATAYSLINASEDCISFIQEHFNTYKPLEVIAQCMSGGLTCYQRLYKNRHFQTFYSKNLSYKYQLWLDGNLIPWPSPELPMITTVQEAIKMQGLSTIRTWAFFVYSAYGNSAITYEQFNRLANKKE